MNIDQCKNGSCSINVTSIDELTQKILQWGIDRNLHQSSPRDQFLKVVEEVGEIGAGMSRNDYDAVLDSVGDVYVTLVMLCMQYGIDIAKCIESAYNEIKDRKGKFVNGVFIKEGD